MSYPALIEKLDMGGPVGGAEIPGAEERAGLMGETMGGKAGEEEGTEGGRKAELLVKGEESAEGGGNWGAVARGLLMAGRGGTGGRAEDTEGLSMEAEPVPERGRPMVT